MDSSEIKIEQCSQSVESGRENCNSKDFEKDHKESFRKQECDESAVYFPIKLEHPERCIEVEKVKIS
ncbi:hypothetical protein HHI36_020776 [Cryptolaemus montrouzieri]|uniref:Uncharacterized protein n=1 Tax=Cryptolaemus montrouzieri TaxID=559131 RepID=A0ABD2NBR0_9CUCU